ncbi:hypothetical protein GCM10007423_16640 [Dyadobacter endophyticus]|uniref:Uncharacterized protein n=1 Tax=Dyadobacter endophyticus TaxID=1749036 RepID=A0ABQ1YK93_9BACT|nr:hypothetical protein [Dyadobacter endophyticus]GGH29354.1 hypothetical protein GCM10007423_16640 [Dyadobacter endophyticus]
MKTPITTILLICTAAFTFAQNGDYKAELEVSIKKLDQAKSVSDFQGLEKTLVQLANTQKTEWLPYYYAAFCNAKIGFLLQDDGEKIEPYSVRGEAQIKRSESLAKGDSKALAEIYVVQAMIYRTKVFISPMTMGRQFGPLSDQFLKKAQKLDAENPRAIYLEAWTKYYTPKLWGGDKDLAKELAGKAIQKLPATTFSVMPHWGKAESETLLR